MSNPKTLEWVKHIFQYLQGTKCMRLFFPNIPKTELIGFADAGYLSDPHSARSQIGYVFTYGGTSTSWRSMKQTIAATSSNHVEILAIHEASRECVWLRSIIQHIRENCGLHSRRVAPTILYDDNTTCIAQLKEGYIKGDKTKHISPKFFFTHDLQKNGDIDVQQIRSCDNFPDLFTKALPTASFEKLVYNIGLRCARDLI
ncbi:hypothetical protein GQ457_01G011530 [Hibiscus cannabinus]